MLNLSLAKSLLNRAPSSTLMPLKYVPFELFCGTHFRKTDRKLNAFNLLRGHNREQAVMNHAVDKINEAMMHVPFYRDYARSEKISKIWCITDLKKFPILDKNFVRENVGSFMDERIGRKFFNITTGGTTGHPLQFKMSNAAYSTEWAFLKHFLREHEISLNEPRIGLRGVEGIRGSTGYDYNHLYKEIRVSPFELNSLDHDTLVLHARDYGCKWIHGYPSSVAEFASVLSNEQIENLGIKGVLLVSEQCSPTQRAEISRISANVVSFYGMSERVIFAHQEDDWYKPNRLYGLTELIDGELVGSGFINQATTLLRYRTGDFVDRAELDDDGFVVKFGDTPGRWGKEFLVGRHGSKVYNTALNSHAPELSLIAGYQFHQKIPGECDIHIVRKAGIKHVDVQVICAIFERKVGGVIKFNPVIVDDLMRTARGKVPMMVSTLTPFEA